MTLSHILLQFSVIAMRGNTEFSVVGHTKGWTGRKHSRCQFGRQMARIKISVAGQHGGTEDRMGLGNFKFNDYNICFKSLN